MIKGNNNGQNSKELYNACDIKIKIKIKTSMKMLKLCTNFIFTHLLATEDMN